MRNIEINFLWSRQFSRTWVWLVVALLVAGSTLVLPVSTIEESKTFYLAAPALLAFALSLAGSFAASVIDDWRSVGRRSVPLFHLLVAVGLPVAVVWWHFGVLSSFASISAEALSFHGLARWSFDPISWAIFVGAALLPVVISILPPATPKSGGD